MYLCFDCAIHSSFAYKLTYTAQHTWVYTTTLCNMQFASDFHKFRQVYSHLVYRWMCVCVLNMHASLHLPYRYDCFGAVRNISIEKKSIIIGYVFVTFFSSSSFTVLPARAVIPLNNRSRSRPLKSCLIFDLCVCVVCATTMHCMRHTVLCPEFR